MAKSRGFLAALLLLLAAGGLAAGWTWWFVSVDDGAGAHEVVSRRPLPESPYLNTKPGVAYVGDPACAKCHAEIATTYREHPMGRSLTLPEDERGGPAEGKPVVFQAGGFEYGVERRGRDLIHSETRRDARGEVVARIEERIAYVLGSGAKGKSYLVEHEGRLVESPISWFAEEERWDLSPGYQNKNHHFGRQVRTGCLFCHANQHHAVPGTVNGYQTPIFSGLAIGCERCHGPGALHAARKDLLADGSDLTIVNPTRLEPALRDAVCEQCHLPGRGRVERLGRSAEEYRPGLPWEDFVRVFVETDHGPDVRKEVGHVEQMRASRCYQASAGALSCVSCHDPHAVPSPEKRDTFYRERCLNCHDTKACTAPEAERRAPAIQDRCVACHMPKSDLKNIVHTAATDHRVLRRREAGKAVAPAPSLTLAPLTAFHPVPPGEEARRELARDLGIAAGLLAYNEPGADRRRLLLAAEPRLRGAVRDFPGDVLAHETLGIVNLLMNREPEAKAQFDMVLRIDPKRELSLVGVAPIAALRGTPGEGLAAIRRALTINPWSASYRMTEANLLALDRDWEAAAESCRDVLKLDPMNLDARRMLIRCALARNDASAAREEARKLLAFQPPEADALRKLIGE